MRRFLAFFFAIFLCTGLYAQSWDAALDQYEQLSEECIHLRQRSLSGEKVPGDALIPLLNQLSSLRKTLQAPDGNMNPEQKMRFEAIRSRYDAAFGNRRTVAAVPSRQPDPFLSRAFLPPVQETGRPSPAPVLEETAPQASPLHISALLYVGIPALNPGLMLGLSKGGWGGFLKGSTTLSPVRASYVCNADGTTDSGYIWTSGKEAKKHFSVTAGGTYSPLPFLGIYAGAGYGKRSLFWEDSGGNWAQVQDRNTAGVAVDAGLLFTWKHFTALAGISTIGMMHVAGEVGVGVRF